MKKSDILDIRYGNITGNGKNDVISLKGNKIEEDDTYIENLSIVIKSEESGEKEYPLGIGGYEVNMFTGKFANEDTDDILIYGYTGGSGNYVIANIYRYGKGKLMEIFNADIFADKYKIKGRYLEKNNIELISEKLQKKYILNISTINKEFLDLIYDGTGRIIIDTDPSVSYINEIKVVTDSNSDMLQLETYQRIIGVTNASSLGGVQTLISLRDGATKIKNQVVISEGTTISELTRIYDQRERIIEAIPEGASIINLNKFGGRNGIIKYDIDGDGNEEILCGYKNKDIQYLGVFREIEGTIKLLDEIEGTGYDISDILITKIKPRGGENIIVGWKIGGMWSVLDILEFRNDKIVKVLKGDKINYSRIEIYDSDNSRNGKNIALWNHETGEAYKVQLYILKGDFLEKTYRDDKEYFFKVEEYYKELINKSRETPQYLYYLIEAQCRAGKKKEAVDNINKALKHVNPYPSASELKRMKRSL